jgi:hypothetical protein
MTTKELGALLSERNAALARQKHRLPRQEAAENDRAYRAADAAIVAELRRRKGPVTLGKVKLHLTRNRLNFAECDAATGKMLWHDSNAGGVVVLYRYPGPAAQRG